MPDLDPQLDFPFPLDPERLRTFLDRWRGLEDAAAQIQEDKRLLREEYAMFLPMHALQVAIKVVRARAKLAARQEEGMSLAHQVTLEDLVAQLLAAQAAWDEAAVMPVRVIPL